MPSFAPRSSAWPASELMKWRRRLRSVSSSPAVAARAASKTKRPAASPSDARGAKKPGQHERDATSLQRECAARARYEKNIHASRSFREMIARPKISRNEWKLAEVGAFEVGHVALSCRPGRSPRRRRRRGATRRGSRAPRTRGPRTWSRSRRAARGGSSRTRRGGSRRRAGPRTWAGRGTTQHDRKRRVFARCRQRVSCPEKNAPRAPIRPNISRNDSIEMFAGRGRAAGRFRRGRGPEELGVLAEGQVGLEGVRRRVGPVVGEAEAVGRPRVAEERPRVLRRLARVGASDGGDPARRARGGRARLVRASLRSPRAPTVDVGARGGVRRGAARIRARRWPRPRRRGPRGPWSRRRRPRRSASTRRSPGPRRGARPQCARRTARRRRRRRSGARRRRPAWNPNLPPDFDERSAPYSSAVLRALDESDRSVQKSAESTSIWPSSSISKFGRDVPARWLISARDPAARDTARLRFAPSVDPGGATT